MSLIQRLSSSILTDPKILLTIVSILAVFGTTQMLTGGIWDAVSHSQKAPETFWSIQHIAVYAGVAMIASSGILGFILLRKNLVYGYTKKGIQIVIIGSILQIFSGYGDSISHEVFGIDGLVSWSHQPLEIGLILSTLGAFFIIKSTPYSKLKKFLPITIITLILAISWLGFNFALLVGGVILCIPVYEIFSSGCAIL